MKLITTVRPRIRTDAIVLVLPDLLVRRQVTPQCL
jgi:hypothetical protein